MFTDSEIEMIAAQALDGIWSERLAQDYAWLWHAIAPSLYLRGQLYGFALARDFLHRFSPGGRPDPTVDVVLLAAVIGSARACREAVANELLVRQHDGPLCWGGRPGHPRRREKEIGAMSILSRFFTEQPERPRVDEEQRIYRKHCYECDRFLPDYPEHCPRCGWAICPYDGHCGCQYKGIERKRPYGG